MNSIRFGEAPLLRKVSLTFKTFSFTEKIIFSVIFLVALVSAIIILAKLNEQYLVKVPHRGGSLTEGIVGSPRFINPVLALSDTDKDAASLIYSGLMKATPEGSLISDLAQEVNISEDLLEYSITLKEGLSFHDGAPLTADDVIFTIKTAQNSLYRSPLKVNWDGITVERVSENQVKFILKQPYSPFIENLTLGILPKHIWENLDEEQFQASLFNTEPIGSGPYEISKLKRNSGGLPIYYELSPFKEYALGEPYIASLILRFYTNEEEVLKAYEQGVVESINGVHPQQISELVKDGAEARRSTLPRIFGVFFNQNQAPLFVNREVRLALNLAAPKDEIVSQVLNGYGVSIDGPLSFQKDLAASNAAPAPSNSASSTPEVTTEEVLSGTDQALAMLARNGWTLNNETGILEKKIKNEVIPLSFSLATGNARELKESAAKLKEAWEKIGAKVDIKVFETGDLNQEIIRPRRFDALLFGEVIGRDFDLYPFWHSSQRNDPGLNIAQYVNIKADVLLENMRKTGDLAEKKELYEDFHKILNEDMPAIFIYSPDFIYVTPSNVESLRLGHITNPSERFSNIYEWYVETNKVWKVFINNNN